VCSVDGGKKVWEDEDEGKLGRKIRWEERWWDRDTRHALTSEAARDENLRRKYSFFLRKY
jgi:hypothetical protein